jgi:hypothetical protein
VTRDQAEREARRLSDEHPDRATHRWVPREDPDGSWSVARILVPEALRSEPHTPTIEARPRPPFAEDPRTAHQRDAPGAWG